MKPHLQQLKDEVAAGKAQLFDVRELHEWEAGHLKDAHLVPLSQLKDGAVPAGVHKDTHAYIHCRSGGRVKTAGPLLEKMGFSVTQLSEGYAELVDQGFDKA